MCLEADKCRGNMFFIAVGVGLLFIYLSYLASVCEMIFVLMILIVLEESE